MYVIYTATARQSETTLSRYRNHLHITSGRYRDIQVNYIILVIFNKSLSMAKAKAFRLFLVFFRAEVIGVWLSPYLYSLGFQGQVTTEIYILYLYYSKSNRRNNCVPFRSSRQGLMYMYYYIVAKFEPIITLPKIKSSINIIITGNSI